MNKRIKKFISIFLVLAVMVVSLPVNGLCEFDFNSFFSIIAEASDEFENDELDTDGGEYYSDDVGRYKVVDGEATLIEGDAALNGKVEIPSVIVDYPVTAIGASAFSGNQLITELVIPDSVVSIGESAFFSCTGLASVLMGRGVLNIYESAFEGCTSLVNAEFGENVSTLADSAFSNCTALEAIEIPSFVSVIGEKCFYNCINLLSLKFNENLKTIGNRAFASCGSLESLCFPDSVTEIGDYAFQNCETIQELVFGASLITIGEGAFSLCDSLVSVAVPDSVEVLGRISFAKNENLKSVAIGEGVSSIGDLAFYQCPSLNEISVDENNLSYSSVDNVLYNKDKTTLIQYPLGRTEAEYSIPDGVINITQGAFYGCEALNKIVIPNTVTCIESAAFYDCINLLKIDISENISVIGRYAFFNSGFYNASANWENGVLYIENNLIAGNQEVPEIYIVKDGTKTIADYALGYSEKLTSLTISEGVENIGVCAFIGCESLENIKISSDIKNIGNNAFLGTKFYNNSNAWIDNGLYIDDVLITVDETVSGSFLIESGTTVIADNAFLGCESLGEVIIPESVTGISENAFADTENIIFYCMPDSYALQYCIDNGINYSVAVYESLKVDASNAKTNYFVGDSLNIDGLILSAIYSNGIEKNVSVSDVTFSMTEFKRSGQFRITVSYADLSSYYTVTVNEPVLESVEIKTMPDKISYVSGESIDTTGLVLTVNYGNSTQKEITEGFVVTGSLDEAGETVVTVSYSENSVTVYTEYSVTVTEGDYAVVSADNMSVLPGEIISVPIKISNNSGFMGFAINIAYDESIFTPVSVLSGEILADGTLNDSIGGNVESGNLKVVFSATENIIADGLLFTVEFKVDKLAAAHISTFDVSYLESDTFDEEWNDVKLICKDFNVEIKGSESSVPMFYAEDIEGKSGLNITVPVMVGNNSGMTSFDLTLFYDSNILNPLSVSSGELIEGEIKSNCSEISGELSLLWNGDVVEQDGTVAYVVFGIDEEAIGNTEITISCGENCDAVGDSFSICISKPGTGSTAEIYSPQVSVLPGQTVDIPLYISNNSGVMGFGLIVSYDSNVLTPVSIEKGDLLSSGTLENNIGNADGSYKIIWNHSADVVGDGLLLTLSFEAAESIEVQNIAISVEFVQADTYNEAWEKVELEINDITLLVDSLIIKSSSSEIYTGETIQLSASYNYSQEACSVVWTTDNAEVADVDENGLVTVYSLGSAKITAVTADGNYSASYEINVIPRTLTVEWSIDGEVTEQTVIEGEEIVEPVAPKKYGYSFSGWTPSIPKMMPAYNLTFTAVWNANSYQAVFDANGGVWSDNQTVKTVNVEFDKEIFEPEAPTKEGYVFGGWSYDGENICDSLGLMDSTDGKFLTAVWIPSDATCYTVETYLMNTNGEYDMTYQIFTGVTEATVSVEPEINIGFELNVENSILEGEILADSSLVLKAYIDRKIYSLTTVVDGVSHTTDYLYEESVTEPEIPEKTGYAFVCWSPEIPETMPAENVTVTAIWSANIYNAVFRSNGGAWLDTSTKKTVKTEYGAEIVAPESPAREGYSFAGWLLDGENMGTDLGIMDDVNGKIFEAAWIVDEYATYTVETYTMNTSGEYDKSVEVVKAKTGEVVSVEPDVSEGFTLNTAKSVLSGTVSADNSLVLKVYIDRNVYSFITVVDGVSSRTSYFYGSIVSEPATPVKSGYKFIKWNGEIPETMPDENVTVTAVFEKLYVCPDCSNEFLGEDAINAHIAAEARMKATVKIKNNSGSKTIDYGETLRLTAITSNMPSDAKVYWYVDGVKKGEGTTFEVSPSSGSVEVTVKLVDINGNAIKNAGGNEISDSEKVSVNAGFFQKIISFFKNLFGMNRTIVQAFKTIY